MALMASVSWPNSSLMRQPMSVRPSVVQPVLLATAAGVGAPMCSLCNSARAQWRHTRLSAVAIPHCAEIALHQMDPAMLELQQLCRYLFLIEASSAASIKDRPPVAHTPNASQVAQHISTHRAAEQQQDAGTADEAHVRTMLVSCLHITMVATSPCTQTCWLKRSVCSCGYCCCTPHLHR